MTSIIRLLTFLHLILISSNCVSADRYFHNRGNDLKDIINIGFEKRNYGITFGIFVESYPIGLFNASYTDYGEGRGLRYGHLGKYKIGGTKIKQNLPPLGSSIPFRFDAFYHVPINPDFRNSNRVYKSYFVKGGTNFLNTFSKNIYGFEVSIAIHYGIRFGINFNEIADFILGISGIDFMDDDLTEDGDYNWQKREVEKRIENLMRFANLLIIQNDRLLSREEKIFMIDVGKKFDIEEIALDEKTCLY
ncbi:MAG: hypothetical protein SFU98_05030 [Leptospiraceae bacterium]|nr:hypothetical protein [Leptospiraceae bacterium]